MCVQDKALHVVDRLRNIRTTANMASGYTSVYMLGYLNPLRSFEAFALKSVQQHSMYEMLN